MRLIGAQNEQIGIVERHVALNHAREAALDLVEVSPTSDPPVCKIMDYGRYLYELKRKLREGRKKSHVHVAVLKEIRLRPEIDKHDLEVKLSYAHRFLEKGHKVQFTLQFRGRQLLHQDKGREVFDYITQATENIAKVDKPVTMADRRMLLFLSPK